MKFKLCYTVLSDILRTSAYLTMDALPFANTLAPVALVHFDLRLTVRGSNRASQLGTRARA